MPANFHIIVLMGLPTYEQEHLCTKLFLCSKSQSEIMHFPVTSP